MMIRVPKRIKPVIPEARDYEIIPMVYTGDVTITETDDEYVITVNSNDAWITLYDRNVRAVAEFTIENNRISKKVYSKYLEQYL